MEMSEFNVINNFFIKNHNYDLKKAMCSLPNIEMAVTLGRAAMAYWEKEIERYIKIEQYELFD